MNTLHMTDLDWHQYIQEFKPNPDQVDAFINDLYQYAKRGNMESGIARFRIEGIARAYPRVEKTKEYRQIIYMDKDNQRIIQEGFNRK